MKESTTYQAVLNEGWKRGYAEGLLLSRLWISGYCLLKRMGVKRFGSPSIEVEIQLTAIECGEGFEDLILRIPESESWEDLFTAMPVKPRTKKSQSTP